MVLLFDKWRTQFINEKLLLKPGTNGFDYFNLGVVDGYDIINKELYRKEE